MKKLFKFIKDLLVALLLLYFIENEFINNGTSPPITMNNTSLLDSVKSEEFNTMDNNNNNNCKPEELNTTDNNNNCKTIIYTSIAVTLLLFCLWWSLSPTPPSPSTDYIKIRKDDIDFIMEQLNNMKEALNINK